MTTREKILEAVLKNQPEATALPDTSMFKGDDNDLVQKYMEVFTTIGGSSFLVDDLAAVNVNDVVEIPDVMHYRLPLLAKSRMTV